MYYIGYDIGGTKCAVSLGSARDGSMQVLAKRQFPTEGAPLEVLSRMADAAEQLLKENNLSTSQIASAGISCGGPLDSRRGVILSPPNLPGWDEIYATDFFVERTGIKTALQNDANACAVAEWKFGAGRGAQNMAFLTFGTGLGAGLILNGSLYSGTSDMAGEVGHIRLAADGPVGYGKRGSAEGFCSGGGIARSCEAALSKAIARGERPAIAERGPITAKLVADMAHEGDSFCRGIYEKCGERLGMLISFMMDMINPELILLGGVFMRSEDLIRPAMERVIAEEALPHAARACRIEPAGLGEKIGDYAALSVAAL
jgi:glucokinase